MTAPTATCTVEWKSSGWDEATQQNITTRYTGVVIRISTGSCGGWHLLVQVLSVEPPDPRVVGMLTSIEVSETPIAPGSIKAVAGVVP